MPGWRIAAVWLAAGLLAGCNGSAVTGQAEHTETFAEIGPDEVLHFTGTEPFWGGEVAGTTLTYSTPEDPDGTAFAVERFAGNNGVSWTGTRDSAEFTLAVTPGRCSDGMSDRTYPFVAMLDFGTELREGCAWTDTNPYTGGEDTGGAPADETAANDDAAASPAWSDGRPVRLTGVSCGDNCYVEYEDEASGEAGSALCQAPLCTPWMETQTLPADARGRLAEIRLGTGTQYDGDYNVMSTDFPAIVAMRWMD